MSVELAACPKRPPLVEPRLLAEFAAGAPNKPVLLEVPNSGFVAVEPAEVFVDWLLFDDEVLPNRLVDAELPKRLPLDDVAGFPKSPVEELLGLENPVAAFQLLPCVDVLEAPNIYQRNKLNDKLRLLIVSRVLISDLYQREVPM